MEAPLRGKKDDGELTQRHNVIMQSVKGEQTETFLGFSQIVAKHTLARVYIRNASPV